MTDHKTAGLVFSVALLALVSCVVSLATTFADSVFLASYPVKALPFYLMGINFTSLVLSMAILKLVARTPTWRGFTGLGLVLAASALYARFGPLGNDWEYIEAARLVLVHTFALMVSVACWNFAANQVHSSHARTWLPAMASGLTVGGLAGGVVTVLASGFIKVDLLHQVTTVLLCCAVPFPFLFGRVMRRFLDRKENDTNSYAIQDVKPSQKSYQKEEISLFRDPLVGFLATVTLLFAIAGTLADYQYKATLQSQGAAEKVALFLGILNTTLNILVLMGQWGFVSKLLNKTSLKGLFGLYPWPILGSIALSFVLPSLYGSFLVRLLERSLRPLIFYSATDTLVAPMRRALKSKVIWLNKGIMTPLGTLLAMGLVMSLYEVSPELVTSPVFIYGLMSSVLLGSLLAARSLSRIYQSHLRKSLGLDVDASQNEGPQIGTISVEQTSIFDPTIVTDVNRVSDQKIQKLLGMETDEAVLQFMKISTGANERGVIALRNAMLQEQDPSRLLHVLLLLRRSHASDLRVPNHLLNHDWYEIRLLARFLEANGQRDLVDGIKKQLTETIVKKRSFKEFGVVFAGALHVLDPGATTAWWEMLLKAAPKNRGAIFEGLAHSFLKGTPWLKWRFSDMKGMRYKDLSQMADYLQKHPFGKTLLSLFRGSAITPEERWEMAFASKSEATRLFNVVINLAVKEGHSRKLFFHMWSHRLQAADGLVVSGYLEAPDPQLRRQAMSLMTLIGLRYGQELFPQKPIVRGLQKTIRESLLVAGALGEMFNAAEGAVLAGHTLTQQRRNRAFRLLNRAFEQQVELFFSFSGLLFGAQITKQAFARFRQGSEFTRANVVEFFRAGELQEVVAPMLNLLNISSPRDMPKFVVEELNLPPGSVLSPRLLERDGFEWFAEFLEFPKLTPAHSDVLAQFEASNAQLSGLNCNRYVAFFRATTNLSPETFEKDIGRLVAQYTGGSPSSLIDLQARVRELV